MLYIDTFAYTKKELSYLIRKNFFLHRFIQRVDSYRYFLAKPPEFQSTAQNFVPNNFMRATIQEFLPEVPGRIQATNNIDELYCIVKYLLEAYKVCLSTEMIMNNTSSDNASTEEMVVRDGDNHETQQEKFDIDQENSNVIENVRVDTTPNENVDMSHLIDEKRKAHYKMQVSKNIDLATINQSKLSDLPDLFKDVISTSQDQETPMSTTSMTPFKRRKTNCGVNYNNLGAGIATLDIIPNKIRTHITEREYALRKPLSMRNCLKIVPKDHTHINIMRKMTYNFFPLEDIWANAASPGMHQIVPFSEDHSQLEEGSAGASTSINVARQHVTAISGLPPIQLVRSHSSDLSMQILNEQFNTPEEISDFLPRYTKTSGQQEQSDILPESSTDITFLTPYPTTISAGILSRSDEDQLKSVKKIKLISGPLLAQRTEPSTSRTGTLPSIREEEFRRTLIRRTVRNSDISSTPLRPLDGIALEGREVPHFQSYVNESSNELISGENGNRVGGGFRGGRGGRGFGGRGGRGRNGFGGDRNGFNGDRDYNDTGFNNNTKGENEGEQKQREFYIPPEPTDNEDEIFNSGISSGINFSKYDNIPVRVSGENAPPPLLTFENAGLRDIIMNNVRKSGYTVPTPIQKTAIPVIMDGRDLMACAQTGSGKTAAFLLPITNGILGESCDLSIGKPQAVIVSPTRELAIQIFSEARKFALGSYLKISIVYGGTSSKYQGENIAKGCHILICTPGRLLDFVEKGFITFEETRYVVLDEADRMMDMGFKDNVNTLMNHPTMRPMDERQNLMFSATFPEEIQRLAGAYLSNYIFITIGVVGGACSDVTQEIFEVKKFQKRSKLMELLSESSDGTIVFVETKRGADFLASLLSETEFPTTSIHGDRLQRQREMALADFKSGKMKVLIATSVAARGLDIKNVKHVINYDLPNSVDEYVHRIGRTGRVGNNGRATSFFDPDQDSAIASDLVKILEGASQEVPQFLRSCSGVGGGGFSNTQSKFGGRDVRKNVQQTDDNFITSAGPCPLEEEENWD